MRGLALLLALLAAPAGAEGLLEGQRVEVSALVLDYRGVAPRVESRPIVLTGGPGVELPSMRAARAVMGDDPAGIVEISVDIGPDEIVLGYEGAAPTVYTDGWFSGYFFALPGLAPGRIAAARLDPLQRLPGMEDGRLTPVEGGLRLHVGGLEAVPGARVRILFPAAAAPGV